MVLTDKKQVLLDIVEDADEKLTGLLIALANEYNDTDQIYSKEELDFFNDSRNAFIANKKKGHTVEEVNNNVRRKYHNGL